MEGKKMSENMSENVMAYLLSVLDAQKKNCESVGDARQEAYYIGMKTMLDMVVSDGYSNGKCIDVANGKHTVSDFWEYMNK